MSTDGFTHVPFSALAEVNPPRGALKLSLDSEVSFIPMGDVTESGRWVGRQTRRFVEVRNGFTNFAEGDVLMAKITPCMENGKGCLARGLVNGVGFGSTEFHVLRAKPESDSGYIHQWSLHAALRKQAKNSMTGSAGQQRVPSGFFDQFRIPAFPQPEQAKIAEVLGAVDRAIEETEALVAKQQRLKAGLMQDLLTRGIDAHGQLRAESTHAFKDSPLGRIPEEWDAVAVGDVGTVVTGNTPPEASFEDDRQSIPFITPGDIGRESTIDSTERSIGKGSAAGARILPAHSICVVCIGSTIGKVAITNREAATNQQINSVVPKDRETAHFLLHSIQLHLPSQLRIEAGLQAVPIVKKSTFSQLLVSVPRDPLEALAIQDRLLGAAQKMDSTSKHLAKLRSLKTALMQDLLTGRRRVTALLPA